MSTSEKKVHMTRRYIQLLLISLVPSLSGCLSDLNLKADIEYEATESKDSDEESKDSEPEEGRLE